MNIYKFESASKLRDYVRDYNNKIFKQEIQRVKDGIKKAAKEGQTSEKFYFADPNIAEDIYESITPELIYKHYEVSLIRDIYNSLSHEPKGITISWKHGGFGPYQIEERLQEYYKTLKEIKKHADDSN